MAGRQSNRLRHAVRAHLAWRSLVTAWFLRVRALLPVARAADIDMDEIRFRIEAAAFQVEGNFAQGAQIPAGETDVDGLADGMQIVVGDAAAVGAQISVGVIRAVARDDVKRFAAVHLTADRVEQVDPVVMWSQGRSGLSRMLIGSVTDRFLRGATCPVLVVPQAGQVTDSAATATTFPEFRKRGSGGG